MARRRSIDDLLDYARKLSFTRADGTKVYGWGFEADNYPNVVMIARAYDGDFITDDYKCVADGPGMIKALTLLEDDVCRRADPEEHHGDEAERHDHRDADRADRDDVFSVRAHRAVQ